LKENWYKEFDNEIKWTQDIRSYLERNVEIKYIEYDIQNSLYRPFIVKQFYYSKLLNWSLYRMPNIFYNRNQNDLLFNKVIIWASYDRKPFILMSSQYISNLNFFGDPANTVPLYRYTELGEKIDNITDWGLSQFFNKFKDESITKEAIFNYVYGVLHNPEYRKKYELNLKREFPRIPFYNDFWKWAKWGEKLMDLHINFETVELYPLKINNVELEREVYKPKLKAIKDEGKIELDNQTTISGIPKEAWDYKLGNRSGLEWILDQYKEKKPKDPTIAKMFNTYKFIDYKDKVIDLISRVTTVSVETMKIIKEMEG